MSLDDRLAVVDRMVEMGVVRLQLTGGEPLIDRYFVETYTAAYDRGIVLTISTNGLWLGKPDILELLQERPPLRVTVSLYGASAESYEAMTRTRPGTFNRYLKSLQSMVDAGVSLRVNTIVSMFNDHEIPQMEALAARFSGDHHVYDTMSASILGSDEPLNLQADGLGGMTRTDRPAFTGCGAGQESFHLDPLGRMSMCKASRETQVSLLGDERELSRLRLSAQLNLTRADGCTSCGIASACTTCPVIVKNYRRAGAPGSFYCRSSSL
jgi:radical SAM protein with 4Fe4S-binding SPASM domain